jgi:hypothetical protein
MTWHVAILVPSKCRDSQISKTGDSRTTLLMKTEEHLGGLSQWKAMSSYSCVM